MEHLHRNKRMDLGSRKLGLRTRFSGNNPQGLAQVQNTTKLSGGAVPSPCDAKSDDPVVKVGILTRIVTRNVNKESCNLGMAIDFLLSLTLLCVIHSPSEPVHTHSEQRQLLFKQNLASGTCHKTCSLYSI